MPPCRGKISHPRAERRRDHPKSVLFKSPLLVILFSADNALSFHRSLRPSGDPEDLGPWPGPGPACAGPGPGFSLGLATAWAWGWAWAWAWAWAWLGARGLGAWAWTWPGRPGLDLGLGLGLGLAEGTSLGANRTVSAGWPAAWLAHLGRVSRRCIPFQPFQVAKGKGFRVSIRSWMVRPDMSRNG